MLQIFNKTEKFKTSGNSFRISQTYLNKINLIEN